MSTIDLNQVFYTRNYTDNGTSRIQKGWNVFRNRFYQSLNGTIWLEWEHSSGNSGMDNYTQEYEGGEDIEFPIKSSDIGRWLTNSTEYEITEKEFEKYKTREKL